MPELINYQLRIIATSADHMHPLGVVLLVLAFPSLLQLPDLLNAAAVSFRIASIVRLVDGPCNTSVSALNDSCSRTALYAAPNQMSRTKPYSDKQPHDTYNLGACLECWPSGIAHVGARL